MRRKGRRGDERFVALLKSMRANGATSAELGKVALEAIDSGWEIATLARAIGVYHRMVGLSCSH
ncbi:MAG: hypothetical protein NZ937_00850 [Armatimonadetes bacterium]|nr:hypothetical protein [Armatimonadota bacterium]